MKELYAEGLATHGGPESCVDDPRGRGEALTGARAGRAIEPRNQRSGVPALSRLWKATPLAALSRAVSGPRAVKEPVALCGPWRPVACSAGFSVSWAGPAVMAGGTPLG